MYLCMDGWMDGYIEDQTAKELSAAWVRNAGAQLNILQHLVRGPGFSLRGQGCATGLAVLC